MKHLIVSLLFLFSCSYTIKEKQYGMETEVLIQKRQIISIDTVCVIGGDPEFGGCVKRVKYKLRNK